MLIEVVIQTQQLQFSVHTKPDLQTKSTYKNKSTQINFEVNYQLSYKYVKHDNNIALLYENCQFEIARMSQYCKLKPWSKVKKKKKPKKQKAVWRQELQKHLIWCALQQRLVAKSWELLLQSSPSWLFKRVLATRLQCSTKLCRTLLIKHYCTSHSKPKTENKYLPHAKQMMRCCVWFV